jgi:hypothetical protein
MAGGGQSNKLDHAPSLKILRSLLPFRAFPFSAAPQVNLSVRATADPGSERLPQSNQSGHAAFADGSASYATYVMGRSACPLGSRIQ